MLRMLNVVNPGNCSGPRMSSGYTHRYYEYIVLAECCVVTQVRGSWKKTSSTPCKNSRSCDKRQCIHLCLLNSLSLSLPQDHHAPSLSMCKIKAFGCSCEKQQTKQKKIRGSIYYLYNIYRYIFLKGPKRAKTITVDPTLHHYNFNSVKVKPHSPHCCASMMG